MKKKKIFLVMLDIGWKDWDGDSFKKAMELGLESEGYISKSLRGLTNPWKQKDFLRIVSEQIIKFNPNVVICFFDDIVSEESIFFLSKVLEIYKENKRPATLILNSQWHWYPPKEYNTLIDGHVLVPFDPANLLRAIEYVLNKSRDERMLYL